MADAARLDGAALVAALDAALPASGAEPPPEDRARGVAAAVALDALLARHRTGWDEVVAGPALLARFCGPLGSDFAAEREAAYTHAVRLLRRSGLSWAAALRLPAALLPAAPVRFLGRPDPAEPPVAAPARAARPAPPAAHVPPAPEGDWPTTLRGMIDRRAWRSPDELRFLEGMLDAVEAGQQLGVRDARAVRDLWWSAEIDPPRHDPPAAASAPSSPDPLQEPVP